MPELAPLDQENTQQPNENVIRGFIVPKGTLLQAKDNKSYILKPSVPAKKENTQDIIFSKPSAGGGFGFVDKAELVEVRTESSDISSTKQQVTREQLLKAAKNHQHDPNNPCCRVQMNSFQQKRKATKKHFAKKAYYTKKKTPAKTVVYAYKQDPTQTKNTERIVYVPLQQSEQEQIKQPKQQVYTNTKEEPNQNKERVVYRDYTNVYAKESPSYQTPCNCPQSNQQTTPAKDAKSYYNPNNYAAGLNSGPTSGDYPVATSASNVDMKYTFYVNPRGKYGVSIYNNNCSVLLSQNGKVMEYKAFGDGGNSGASSPKLNYFGSPESIAGIPIEYNYNRTVHKIGNIRFDYDFEGFFKTVGNSMVFYNSRSSLSKVDNINVKYDASGNVTSVDSNNGIIQYNP